jgi:hypothetical protein
VNVADVLPGPTVKDDDDDNVDDNLVEDDDVITFKPSSDGM